MAEEAPPARTQRSPSELSLKKGFNLTVETAKAHQPAEDVTKDDNGDKKPQRLHRPSQGLLNIMPTYSAPTSPAPSIDMDAPSSINTANNVESDHDLFALSPRPDNSTERHVDIDDVTNGGLATDDEEEKQDSKQEGDVDTSEAANEDDANNDTANEEANGDSHEDSSIVDETDVHLRTGDEDNDVPTPKSAASESGLSVESAVVADMQPMKTPVRPTASTSIEVLIDNAATEKPPKTPKRLQSEQSLLSNEKIEAAMKELEAAKEKVHVLEQSVSELEDKVKSLEAENLTLTKRLELSNERLNKEKQDTAALKQKFTAISQKQKAAFDKMKLQRNTAQEQLEQSQGLVQKLRIKAKKLESDFRTKTLEVDSIRENTDLLEKKFSLEKQQLQETSEKEKANVKSELEKIQRTLEDKEKLEELQRTMDAFIECTKACNGQTVKVQVQGVQDFRVQWHRSFNGSQFEPVQGANETTYVLTVDDVGAVIKAHCVANNQTDLKVSAEVGPVELNEDCVNVLSTMFSTKDPHVEIEVKAPDVVARADSKKKKPRKNVFLTSQKIKIREGSKTTVKAEYTHHTTMAMDPDNPAKFSLQIDERKIAFTYLVSDFVQRDQLAMILRVFAQLHLLQLRTNMSGPLANMLIREANLLQSKMNSPAESAFGTPNTSAPVSRETSFYGNTPTHSRNTTMDAWDVAGPTGTASVTPPVSNTRKGDLPPAIQEDAKADKAEDNRRGFDDNPWGEKQDDFDMSDSDDEPEKKFEIKWREEEAPSNNKEALSSIAAGLFAKKSGPSKPSPSPRAKGKLKPAKVGRRRAKTELGDSKKGSRAATLRPKRNRQNKDNITIHELASNKLPGLDLASISKREDKELDKVEAPLSNVSAPLEEIAEVPVSEPAPEPEAKPKTEPEPEPTPKPQVETFQTEGLPIVEPQAVEIAQDDPFADLVGKVSPRPLAKPLKPSTSPRRPQLTAHKSLPTEIKVSAPSGSTSSLNQIQALVTETLYVRMSDGQPTSFRAIGEIDFKLPSARSEDTAITFKVGNVSHISSMNLNPKAVESDDQGRYKCLIRKNTLGVAALKYKVRTSTARAGDHLPIILTSAWDLQDKTTTIDVNYDIAAHIKQLRDVRVVLGVGPERSVKSCTFAHPKCMYNRKQQKLMWKFGVLPDQALHSSGKLHARLETITQSSPSPVTCTFTVSVSKLVSGLELSVVDADASVQYRLKSGEYLCQ